MFWAGLAGYFDLYILLSNLFFSVRHKKDSGRATDAGVWCMESVCEQFKWKYNSISSQGLR